MSLPYRIIVIGGGAGGRGDGGELGPGYSADGDVGEQVHHIPGGGHAGG